VSPWRQHGGAVLELRRIGRGAVVEAPAWGQQSSSAPTDRRGGTAWIHDGAWGARHGGMATSHEWGGAPAMATHGVEAEGRLTG
jgi:hypothetical protein